MAKGKLAVSATVVATCKMGVSVPKVGSKERNHGGIGDFSVVCTHGGVAAATMVQQESGPRPRTDNRYIQLTLSDGVAFDARTVIAEVLF